MMRLIRRARVASSDVAAVRSWVSEYTDFLNTKAPPGARVQAWTEVFGDYGVVYWTLDHHDLGDVDTYFNGLTQHDEYREILKQGSELFLSGHTRDTLLRELT